MRDQRAFRNEGDISGGGFHVGNDVSGENHDAFAGKVRKQVAEADAFFGIEPGGRFVDDEQLRIVEQGLGDADTLLHSPGEPAQRALADVGEVNQVEQFVNAALGGRRIQAFDCGQVLQELDRIQVGVNAEILRQIAEDGAHGIRVYGQVDVVPCDLARSGASDGGEDAHQCGLAGPVWTQQAQYAGSEFEAEVAQGKNIVAVLLADVVDDQLQELPPALPKRSSVNA